MPNLTMSDENIMPDEDKIRANQKKGRINKRKGNGAERKYAKIFRLAGWLDALTMRYVSKLKDDRKIDLHAVPVNMQIKAGVQKALNIRQALREVKEAVAKLPSHFPEHNYHAVVLHDKGPTFFPAGTVEKGGWKTTEFDDIVSMTFNDYFNLLCMVHDKGKYKLEITLLDEELKPIPTEDELPKQD